MTDDTLTLPSLRRAADLLIARDEETLASQIELSEIPAPPFQEGARASRMKALLGEAGLENVELDPAGNVVARREGATARPPLVVSAHLDTVFPPETDVRVRRSGDILYGPGISDDARGLATLLALARVMEAEGLRTDAPLIFAATVGEEGIGDLRGVKQLFSEGGACRQAGGFISLDGAGLDRIVVEGLASRRYRIEISGPGGHSWVDWGTPNPLHALMEAGSRLAALLLPPEPRTTLTVARAGGGTSINAIPGKVWMEVDTRSAEPREVDGLQAAIRRILDEVAQDRPGLDFALQVVGDRPGGRTPMDVPLVLAALEATRAVGGRPLASLSSTDANVPMSLGIPALTMGCGGEAGLAHTTDEWYRNTEGPRGAVRALYTVALAAGVADGP